jgi:hypothetical protein
VLVSMLARTAVEQGRKKQNAIKAEVEVDIFGLLPDHIGLGLGSHFLTVGVRLAWAVAPAVSRVWLHTSTRDNATPCPTTKGVGSVDTNSRRARPVSPDRDR